MDLAHLGFAIETAALRAANAELDRMPGKARGAETGVSRLNRQIEGMNRLFNLARGALIGFFGAFSVHTVVRMIDEFTSMSNILGVVAAEGADVNKTIDQLNGIATRTRAPLSAITQLFQRASITANELGASQADLLRFTENVGLALAQTGGSAASASGALLQLSQALGSGIIRAEEFNSVLEGALPIAQAAARGLEEAGGSVAKLRQLVIDGKVTSDAFFQAILSQTDELEEAFAKTVPTLGQAFTVLGNNLTVFLGRMDQATGASAALAQGIINVATWLQGFALRIIPLVVDGVALLNEHLDDLFDLFVVLVTTKIVLFLASAAGAFITLARTVRTAGLVMAAVNAITKVKITTLALLAAVIAKLTGTYDNLVGWIREMGTALLEALPPEMREGIDDITTGLQELLFGIDDVDSAAANSLAAYLDGANEAAASLGETTDKATRKAIKAYDDLVLSTEQRIGALEAEAAALGLTQVQAKSLVNLHELIAEAEATGVPLTEKRIQQLIALSDRLTDAQLTLEGLQITMANRSPWEVMGDEIERLNELMARGKITAQDYWAEIGKAAETAMGTYASAARGILDQVSGLFDGLFELERNRIKASGLAGEELEAALEASAKRQFEINKQIAIANAIVAGGEAIVKAFNWGTTLGGPIGGALAAGVAAAATAAQIAAIASSSFESKSMPNATAGAASAAPGGAPQTPSQALTINFQREGGGRQDAENFWNTIVETLADQGKQIVVVPI